MTVFGNHNPPLSSGNRTAKKNSIFTKREEKRMGRG
jgi:hypothetical protein